MARPMKKGIDYFPFDVDFFDDDKIALIESEFGPKAIVVALRLLCKIYKDTGYYYQWGDDACLLLSRQLGDGFVPSLVNEIVSGLVRRSFFNKGVFDSFGILTSAGIQRRYSEAVKGRKIRELRSDTGLIEKQKEISTKRPELISKKPELISDLSHKEKKSKLKKNKENSFSRTHEAFADEERNEFFEIFFWRNVINPQDETDRFIEYNSRFGWKALPSRDLRRNAAMAWKPQNGIGRVNEKLLEAWKALYVRLKTTDTDAAAKMLDSRFHGAINNGEYVIYADKSLWKYIKPPAPELAVLKCPLRASSII